MSPEQLEAYGFRESKTSSHDRHDAQWWYTVKDKKGKKFPILVRFWRMSKYSSPERGQVEDGWDSVAYFKLTKDRYCHVEMGCRHETPEQLVRQFKVMFTRLRCRYNSLWGE